MNKFRLIRHSHQPDYVPGWSAMRFIAVFLVGICIHSGCRSGLISAERAAAKREKFVADSIKYAKLKDDFSNGRFVFRISRINNTKLNPVDNWIMIADGEAHCQYHKEANLPTSQKNQISPQYRITQQDQTSSPHYQTDTVYELRLTEDNKKHTVTQTGAVRNILPYFQLTLYEGSDKADGYLNGPYESVEGYVESIPASGIGKKLPYTTLPHVIF